ncbi:hypothetical protein LguiB_004443 [Lonicera macranthoides]
MAIFSKYRKQDWDRSIRIEADLGSYVIPKTKGKIVITQHMKSSLKGLLHYTRAEPSRAD